MKTTLLLLFASLLVAGSLADMGLDDFEGHEDLDDINRPYVVLNFLRQARQRYENKPDGESRAKLERLNTLIGLSDVSEDKCDESHLKQLETLLVESAKYLTEYVEAFRERQLLKCQSVFAEVMNAIANGLGESDKELAGQLRAAILDVKQGESPMGEDLTLAVAQVVGQRLADKTNVNEADFATAYHSSIGSFCESLVKQLKLSPGLWQVTRFPWRSSVLNKFTRIPADWLSLARACQDLVTEPFDVSHGYATYLANN